MCTFDNYDIDAVWEGNLHEINFHYVFNVNIIICAHKSNCIMHTLAKLGNMWSNSDGNLTC